MNNNNGYCECGCGNPAPIANRNDKRFGWIKGQPKRFIHNHHTQKYDVLISASLENRNTNNGYCMCGCGEVAPLAPQTMTSKNWVKGEPVQYIHGHNQKGKISGENNPMWGRKASEETRAKMSAAHKGEKSWNWKGGITSDYADARGCPEYKEWRFNVIIRDDFTCQDCDRRGGILHAHHLRSFAKYKELRYELDNGITLCIPCHKERHKKI